MNKFFKYIGLILGTLLLTQLTGCQATMPTPQATVANMEIGSKINQGAVNVGDFSTKAGVEDKSISIRANNLTSPINHSFAKHLQQTLYVELEAAGLLDKTSDKTITGTLIDNKLNSHGTGTAALAAIFNIKQNEQFIFEKEISVHSTWSSSFIGAVAIPEAAAQYEDLYRKLVGKLFSDPDFQKAVTP